MRKVLFVAVLMACSMLAAKTTKFTVLQWNIWQEGTMVPGGYDAIIDEIVRLEPDFVTFSEVRNYKNTKFNERVVKSLAERGLKYYSFLSYDTGLLSRYPIKDSTVVYPLNNDHGTVHRLLTELDGKEIAVYTAHLDYLKCAYYNVKGYHGSTWKEIPIPTSVAEVLTFNEASLRDDAMCSFLEAARKDVAQGRTVIIGGDFNEPSHLDWTRETKDMFDHHGLIIPWTCTLMLDNAGFVDAYRELYPDVLKYPGFTYPTENQLMPVNKLTWAPKADERERIDYIFYYPQEGLSVKKAAIFGPEGFIVRNERVVEDVKDPMITPMGVYPSDHKGLLIEFMMKH